MFSSVNDRFNIPPIMTVTSGKGGVGKSIMALILSKLVSAEGVKTLLVDGNLGLGSLHILTNTIPALTVEDCLEGTCGLEEAAITVIPNLDLLSARSGYAEDDLNPGMEESKLRLLLAGSRSQYDLIIFDTSPGITKTTMTLASLADELLLVVTPELAALADGYAVLKQVSKGSGPNSFWLFVNMVQSDSEGADTADKFSEMARQFLGLKLKHLFWFPYDVEIKPILLRQNLLDETDGDCQLVRRVKTALTDTQTLLSVQNLRRPNAADLNSSSDLMLSSQGILSDTRTVILYGGEPNNKLTNQNSIASRESLL